MRAEIGGIGMVPEVAAQERVDRPPIRLRDGIEPQGGDGPADGAAPVAQEIVVDDDRTQAPPRQLLRAQHVLEPERQGMRD